MPGPDPKDDVGAELNDRERQVLEAVVRTYVETAEPAGSRTVSRGFGLGISAATVRNTMSDLEEKGYLFHPHTSAGRVPTDQAYRFFVDRLMAPLAPSPAERASLERELERAGSSAMERLILHATRALSLISNELGIAVAPRLEDAGTGRTTRKPTQWFRQQEHLQLGFRSTRSRHQHRLQCLRWPLRPQEHLR
jgi:heat-inducible transcriptional repressor